MFIFLMICLMPFVLSYLILKFIYRIIFKSKKKVSKLLVFIVGVGLLIFYYTPYSFYLEPSYWEFKKICKLNELPNDEEKYNKILSYFDTDLDSLDWEELNENSRKLTEQNLDYKQGVFEYITQMKWKQLNFRTEIQAHFFSDKEEINQYNANAMIFQVIWHSKRYFLERRGVSFDLIWKEEIVGCSTKDNMTPKE